VPHEEGLREPDDGAEDDQGDHDEKGAAVRSEEMRDPRQRDGVDLELAPISRIGTIAARAA
jgi:hypothetical protein